MAGERTGTVSASANQSATAQHRAVALSFGLVSCANVALNLLKQDKATNSASSDAAVHPAVPDYIPRRNEAGDWRYASEEALFGRLSPSEDALIDDIAALVGRAISLAPGAPVLAPYAIGGLSITHQLARRADGSLAILDECRHCWVERGATAC